MKPLLIEIGSEEIPARFISRGLAILKEELTLFFDKSSIDYGSITEYSTPRRLTLIFDNVAEMQKNKTVETLGPPQKVAYNADGEPTKAAIGFARNLNIDLNDLELKETERGLYLSATIEEKGRPTIDVLAEELPKIISSMKLPKSMRWGNSPLRYFRPIQWILTLFGKDILQFKLDEMKSSNITYGHRFLSPAAIKVEEASEYLSLLKQNHVIADPDERKKMISEGINKLQSEIDCIVHNDDELLDTVTNLVEYPTVVAGKFNDKYLDLPDELLITVMKSHQKYFSTEDSSGNMQPFFVLVSNTRSDNNDTVRKGAERVLRARLEDARFYFNDDRKIPLYDYTKELKKVTFQEKLGSVFVKTERISSLCSFISEKAGIDSKDNLHRAALLCKADLVTGVVGEFPELQGYMGMKYALSSGEDKETALAIHEHYMPKFAGDKLPSGNIGSILSIADKMDSIASFFFLGLIPTGSEDPYALRRQATGIIHILNNSDYPLTLDDLIDNALSAFESSTDKREALTDKILQFFYQRLEGIFLAQNYVYDSINAVLAVKGSRIQELKQKLDILSNFRKSPDFPGLLTAAKRVYNILSKYQPGELKKDLLLESSEKDLYDAVQGVNEKLIETDFKTLFELAKPIDAFFEHVLVMDKDPQIKENRLALLASVKAAFDSLCDFSKIVE